MTVPLRPEPRDPSQTLRALMTARADASAQRGSAVSREPLSGGRGAVPGVMDFVPGVGDALSAYDAVEAFKGGHPGRGLLSAMAAVPVLGTVADGARALVKGADKAGDGVRGMARALRENPNFRRWFGESKVVDAEGNPMVVFHGTRRSFDAFDPAAAHSQTGNPNAALGHFFSPSPKEASRYASDWGKEGGNVMPVVVRLNDPYPMPYKEADDLATGVWRRMNDGVSRKGGDPYFQSQEFKDRTARIEAEARAEAVKRREELMREGYDGIVTRIGGLNEYVAFDPTQIKSVFNRGTFDPTNPNILLGAGGLIAAMSARDQTPPPSPQDPL
jgi:ADP-Ribosyltransferase in polyvalent proteins